MLNFLYPFPPVYMSCNLWSVFLPVSPSPCHPLASSFIRMDYSNLRRQAASMKKSLFDQACIILWRFLINILSLCFHKDLEVRSYLFLMYKHACFWSHPWQTLFYAVLWFSMFSFYIPNADSVSFISSTGVPRWAILPGGRLAGWS